MNAVLLLLSTVAIAICCMDLALAIVYRNLTHQPWAKYFIIFCATAIGGLFVQTLLFFSRQFLTGLPLIVMSYILEIILLADTAFILVFFPFFTTWLIAHPWRNPYKGLFFTLAGIYLALGIAEFILVNPYITLIKFGFAIFVFIFCFSIITKNYRSISDKYVRRMCFTLFITFFSITPIFILGFIFDFVRDLSILVLAFAISIVLLVFLFIALSKRTVEEHKKEEKKEKELTVETLKEYHITEREIGVIKLIKEGLTNKEIAHGLNISVNTVNNHIANIYSKTNVRSRIDLLNLIQDVW